MSLKGQWKIPKADGTGYEILNEKKFAEMINFSNTTLADVLSKNEFEISHVANTETAEKTEKDLSGNILTEFYLTSNNAAMSGTPTAPEYDGTDTAVSQIATCGYFNGLVRKVAGSTDVTVAKIIAALNGDPNFATTTATKIDAKQSKTTNLTALNKLGSETGIILATSSDTLTTFSATETGKKILVASDFENFRGIIQAPTAETFLWDETEKIHWEKVGSPYLSTANARFSKALQCSAGNYVQPKETITFGGNPFTVDIWNYVSSSIAQFGTILSFSQSGNNGMIKLEKTARTGYDGSEYLKIYNSSGTKIVDDSVFDRNNTYDWNKNIHIEICYNGSTVYLFIDGVRKFSANCTIERLARTINLGSADFIGTISEFRILDGVCLHTGNFSPPTAPYDYESASQEFKACYRSLLHFEKSY